MGGRDRRISPDLCVHHSKKEPLVKGRRKVRANTEGCPLTSVCPWWDTHTHTNSERDRDRQREKERKRQRQIEIDRERVESFKR
jgi:hypothetical protein